MFWLLLGLLVTCALCSWLRSGSSLAQSASNAFESSLLLLGGADAGDGDETRTPSSSRALPRKARPPARAFRGHSQPLGPVKRKRITPFIAKKVGSLHRWRCAACGELLTEDFEIDHHIS